MAANRAWRAGADDRSTAGAAGGGGVEGGVRRPEHGWGVWVGEYAPDDPRGCCGLPGLRPKMPSMPTACHVPEYAANDPPNALYQAHTLLVLVHCQLPLHFGRGIVQVPHQVRLRHVIIELPGVLDGFLVLDADPLSGELLLPDALPLEDVGPLGALGRRRLRCAGALDDTLRPLRDLGHLLGILPNELRVL